MEGRVRPNNGLILILGGARSGKSAYAEELAARLAGEQRTVLYVATATAGDGEMRARIAAHRASRPTRWRTVEAPLDPAEAVRDAVRDLAAGTEAGVILLDCVTLLVSNILLDGAQDAGALDALDALDADEMTAIEARVMSSLNALLALRGELPMPMLCVSNEVGMGLVPPYPLGRVYRDILGRANILLAREAETVLLLVAGLPVEVKALSAAWRREADQRYGQRGQPEGDKRATSG